MNNMDKELYEVFQLEQGATEQEVDYAYQNLKQQYKEQRFLAGDEGSEAARKLTELENAYTEIKKEFEIQRIENNISTTADEIEALIKSNKINEAQEKLDELTNRNAEWHYLQSIIFYKKKWYDESRYQLEMCLSQDPNNTKYKEALDKLDKFMQGKNNKNKQQPQQPQQQPPPPGTGQQPPPGQQGNDYYRGNSPYNNPYNNPYDNRNMGAGATNCCCQLLCADICCECFGGDLILCC